MSRLSDVKITSSMWNAAEDVIENAFLDKQASPQIVRQLWKAMVEAELNHSEPSDPSTEAPRQ